MQWNKLGLVFCPNQNYPWMWQYAAVPFAEFLEGDVYRIYFSARDIENRAHIGYIDIDIKDPFSILQISKAPVLAPGALGTFDDSGVMVSWITNFSGKKYLYYIGWNLGVTVPFRNSTGLAVWDGENFNRCFEGPVLDRNILEPHFATNPCVLVENELWRMWYLSCTQWKMVGGKPKHYYHIKYAESSDGIHWQRDGTVCIDFKNSREYAISRPCVIKDKDCYKMWYSYRGDHYLIGYAESSDGIHWRRKDEMAGIDVSESGWDSEMIEYPHVFDHQGSRYMLFNGNGYGKTGFGLAVLE
jgi:predicted GH43/DUF377 family glycosyl hydrolase